MNKFIELYKLIMEEIDGDDNKEINKIVIDGLSAMKSVIKKSPDEVWKSFCFLYDGGKIGDPEVEWIIGYSTICDYLPQMLLDKFTKNMTNDQKEKIIKLNRCVDEWFNKGYYGDALYKKFKNEVVAFLEDCFTEQFEKGDGTNLPYVDENW